MNAQDDPWRRLVVAMAEALWLDRLADWLSRRRWLIWLDRQSWFAPTGRVLLWANVIGWSLLPVGVFIAYLLTR